MSGTNLLAASGVVLATLVGTSIMLQYGLLKTIYAPEIPLNPRHLLHLGGPQDRSGSP
jgi:hypothetical protein